MCFGTRFAVAADLEQFTVTALCSFEDILAHDVTIPDVIRYFLLLDFSRIRETGHERLVEASPTAQVSDLDQRIVYEGRHPDSFVIRTCLHWCVTLVFTMLLDFRTFRTSRINIRNSSSSRETLPLPWIVDMFPARCQRIGRRSRC